MTQHSRCTTAIHRLLRSHVIHPRNPPPPAAPLCLPKLLPLSTCGASEDPSTRQTERVVARTRSLNAARVRTGSAMDAQSELTCRDTAVDRGVVRRLAAHT
jgi:hypothetical protein